MAKAMFFLFIFFTPPSTLSITHTQNKMAFNRCRSGFFCIRGSGRFCGIRLSADQRAGGKAAVPEGDDGVCLSAS